MTIEIPNDRYTRLKIKATGQVEEFAPAVARAMLAGGTAELVETGSIDPSPEHAVAPAQTKKPKAKSGR